MRNLNAAVLHKNKQLLEQYIIKPKQGIVAKPLSYVKISKYYCYCYCKVISYHSFNELSENIHNTKISIHDFTKDLFLKEELEQYEPIMQLNPNTFICIIPFEDLRNWFIVDDDEQLINTCIIPQLNFLV